jgi:sugar lactone lactonase YvrE
MASIYKTKAITKIASTTKTNPDITTTDVDVDADGQVVEDTSGEFDKQKSNKTTGIWGKLSVICV